MLARRSTFLGVVVLMILVGEAVGANVALDKPASSNDTYYTTLPSMAVDGNLDTLWSANSAGSPSSPIWLDVDLGVAYPVDRIVLIGPYSGNEGLHVDYELYGSLDGITWGDPIGQGSLVDTATMSERSNTIDVGGSAMRYVRFSGVGGSHWTHLSEMEVYSVPEPSTIVLLSVGAISLIAYLWRRRMRRA
jgi:hypothetical protein